MCGEKCQTLPCSWNSTIHKIKIIDWKLIFMQYTKLKKQVGSDRLCYFWPPSLASNRSLSFEARDLKVLIQAASSFAKNAPIFCLGAEKNGGFYSADKTDRTSAIMLFLTFIFDLKYLLFLCSYLSKFCDFSFHDMLQCHVFSIHDSYSCINNSKSTIAQNRTHLVTPIKCFLQVLTFCCCQHWNKTQRSREGWIIKTLERVLLLKLWTLLKHAISRMRI